MTEFTFQVNHPFKVLIIRFQFNLIYLLALFITGCAVILSAVCVYVVSLYVGGCKCNRNVILPELVRDEFYRTLPPQHWWMKQIALKKQRLKVTAKASLTLLQTCNEFWKIAWVFAEENHRSKRMSNELLWEITHEAGEGKSAWKWLIGRAKGKWHHGFCLFSMVSGTWPFSPPCDFTSDCFLICFDDTSGIQLLTLQITWTNSAHCGVF